ncbi:MAG TPA: cell wall hydrolase [Clostridiaceae bacterium]|nr:cell wall hydrolase [Clostridiaceae bacterium]
MIVVLKKSSVALVCLIFTLLLVIFSLNINIDNNINDMSSEITDNRDIQVTKEGGQQKTVILDPGHGGEDPGAVSEYSGIKEKDVNLKIAFKLKELLEKDNCKVIMTRTEDILEYDENTTNIYQKRKQDLTRRKKIMDDSGADIVVSIHLNEFPQTQYYGAQVFYPPDSNDSQKLANSIQKVLKKDVDPTNKRVAMVKEPPKGQKPIMILRDIKTTTVIVECGFLSNFDEEKKLRTDEYQNKIADAIKTGIINYFKDAD